MAQKSQTDNRVKSDFNFAIFVHTWLNLVYCACANMWKSLVCLLLCLHQLPVFLLALLVEQPWSVLESWAEMIWKNGQCVRLLAGYTIMILSPFPVHPYNTNVNGGSRQDYLNTFITCRKTQSLIISALLIDGLYWYHFKIVLRWLIS